MALIMSAVLLDANIYSSIMHTDSDILTVQIHASASAQPKLEVRP